MTTLTTYTWGTVLRTREEDRQGLINQAMDLIMDYIDTDPIDDLPTYESNGIGRNFNHLCDVGFNQRTNPKYNFTSRNKDRR